MFRLFRIRYNLVRIRILGSVPLTNRSLFFLKVHLRHSSQIKSQKNFFMIGRTGSIQDALKLTNPDPEHWYLKGQNNEILNEIFFVAWIGYRSGSPGLGCRAVSSKMMPIRPEPDPQVITLPTTVLLLLFSSANCSFLTRPTWICPDQNTWNVLQNIFILELFYFQCFGSILVSVRIRIQHFRSMWIRMRIWV